MSRPKIDLGLKNVYDELFMDDKGREENRLQKIYNIPLSEIDDFPDHPFQVRLDEDMEQLVESVKERGIITPITLRQKEDGRYEIVSGHRRKKACELAGMDTVKAEIRELTRDEAIILMVESNLQRSVILPSEKAFAYKMKLDAMKRLPGRPPKENGATVLPQFDGKKSRELLAEQSGESHEQIRKYIRLTNLNSPLLDLVDDNKIALRPAVELSYLTQQEQEDLAETISYEDCTPSHAQAIKMRRFSEEGKLDADTILSIMCEEKGNQKEKISFQAETFRRWIPKGYNARQTEEHILKALEYYHRYLERQKEDRNAR